MKEKKNLIFQTLFSFNYFTLAGKIDNFIGQDFESESVFFDYYYAEMEVGYNLTHTATVTNMGNVGSTFTQTYKECIVSAK